MKRFVWRLQRVLDIRTKEEQKARAELLKLTEKLAETQSELLTWRKMLEEIINGLAVGNPKKRLGRQEFFLRYSAASDEQIKKLENRAKELESKQREKIAEVLKLRRLKEGLEKLQVEAKKQFITEQEKLDQQQLDEGATVLFVRKTKS
ncbi:MAG: flagellar export protein FliJ [Planctomycetota bacterium]|jgi:flagellar FliJ protein